VVVAGGGVGGGGGDVGGGVADGGGGDVETAAMNLPHPTPHQQPRVHSAKNSNYLH